MLKKIASHAQNSYKLATHEVNRLLTAAVINSSFRNLFLNDPSLAIASGFHGEHFHLGSVETQQVTSIHANSLADFATQLANQ
jgi:hypothetical protein